MKAAAIQVKRQDQKSDEVFYNGRGLHSVFLIKLALNEMFSYAIIIFHVRFA
jgi:hypothetical protein